LDSFEAPRTSITEGGLAVFFEYRLNAPETMSFRVHVLEKIFFRINVLERIPFTINAIKKISFRVNVLGQNVPQK
jgi:hypothetical protein